VMMRSPHHRQPVREMCIHKQIMKSWNLMISPTHHSRINMKCQP
jgi:hypothetical protein